MKRKYGKYVVSALVISMIFTQPMVSMASENKPVSGEALLSVVEESQKDESVDTDIIEQEDRVTDNDILSSDEIVVNDEDDAVPENGGEESCLEESREYTAQSDGAEETDGIGNGNVAKYCASSTLSAVIDTEGYIWEWGCPPNDYSSADYYSNPNRIREFDGNYDYINNVKDMSLGLYSSGDSSQMKSFAYIDASGTLHDRTRWNNFSSPSGIVKISMGQGSTDYYAAAIDREGNLWTWNYVDVNGGGSGKRPDMGNPTILLEGTKFKDVCLGAGHHAAIDIDGNLWMWGNNKYGQIGVGYKSDETLSPTKIMEGTKFRQVSLGYSCSGAIDTDGNLWMWGYNNRLSIIPNSTDLEVLSPQKVMEGTRFKQISLGHNSSAATIDIDGKLWTWGNNNGDGTGKLRKEPMIIMQGTCFKEVCLTSSHGGAIDENGNLWMWGENNYGSLGDGTRENRSTPVMIIIPEIIPSGKCKVTFNSQGGSTVPSQIVTSGSYVIKPEDPQRDGYQFEGWYKDEKCTKEWIFNKDKVTDNPTILYAKWTEIRTIRNPRRGEDSTTWDCIWFGKYYQYNKGRDGKYYTTDPIKWRILHMDEEGNALLLSDKNLDIKQYQNNSAITTWADSDIRKWLNNDFKEKAFSLIQQDALLETNNDGVSDQVFLLSYEDTINESYGFNKTEINHIDYNGADGDYSNPDIARVTENTYFCNDGDKNWFLRNPHHIVEGDGTIFKWSNLDYQKKYKIRPAIRINLYESSNLWADAGTVCSDGVNGSYTSYSEPENRLIRYNGDTWAFNNAKVIDDPGFGGFARNNSYYINQSDYDILTCYLDKPVEKDFFKQNYAPKMPNDRIMGDYLEDMKYIESWDGSCSGMSLSEGLYMQKTFNPSAFRSDAVSIGDIGNIAEHITGNADIESRINLYHFMQATETSINSKVSSGFNDNPFQDLMNKAKSVRNVDDIFQISYVWNDNGESKCHVVLCYGGEVCSMKTNSTEYSYKLLIYDPNNSRYHNDDNDIYISSDGKKAYIPFEKKSFDPAQNSNKIYYRNVSLFDLCLDRKGTSQSMVGTEIVSTKMQSISFWDALGNLTATFKNGISIMSSSLVEVIPLFGDDGEAANEQNRRSYYDLGTCDLTKTYTVKGGDEDKLDVDFVFGDHIVGVEADTKGVSATVSGNGSVALKGLKSTVFTIKNIYNNDCQSKPGDLPNVYVSARTSGDIVFTQNSNEGYVLTSSDNNKLTDVNIIYGGATFESETQNFKDAVGKITVSFNGMDATVLEDTDGDGNLDYEKNFTGSVPIKEISIDPSSISINVGETKTLSANIIPSEAKCKNVRWSSDNTDVITVSEGKLKGVSKGTATVKALATDGSGVIGTCSVKVTDSESDDPDIPDNPPEGIWIKGLKTSYPYTGSAIKPEFKVYRGKTRLYLNTDYSLRYRNNTKPGTATITIKMKGNYSGSKDVAFKIDPAELGTDVTADTVYLAYKNNKLQKPKPELYINGTKLKYGKNDMTITYPSEATGTEKPYVDPGTYKIHIAAKNTNMFKNEMDVDLVIAEKPLMKDVSIKASKNRLPYYNGNAVSPVFTLTYKGKAMSEGTDYTVSYADDHTDIGKHKVTFIGNNKDYFGKKTVTFSITGKYDLTSDNANVKLDAADLNPDGSAPFTYGGAKPGAVVRYNGVKLTAGKDYTISYANNKNLGTATATIKGKGSYTGSVPKEFAVKARDINSINMNLADVIYSAKKDAYKKTSVVFVDKNNKDQKMKLNTDYTLSIDGDYGDAPAAGTEIKVIIQGKGNYTGTINNSYRIIDSKYDFTKGKIVVNDGKPYDYTGDEIKPLQSELKVTVNNTTLGTDDYEISGYYNNIKKGNSAYIKLRGKGKYAGIQFVKFKIGAAPIERIWSDTILSLKSFFAW